MAHRGDDHDRWLRGMRRFQGQPRGLDFAPMETGVAMFPTHDAIDPGALAALVEERGFESIWVPRARTSRRATRPIPPAAISRGSTRNLDPFVALTAVATVTRLRLGIGICLIIQRDPIVTAKAVASID